MSSTFYILDTDNKAKALKALNDNKEAHHERQPEPVSVTSASDERPDNSPKDVVKILPSEDSGDSSGGNENDTTLESGGLENVSDEEKA